MQVVLLLQAGDDGPVKIVGATDKQLKRVVNNIQHGCPEIVHVRAVLDGDERLERRLHVLFETQHRARDWYRPEILSLVPADVPRTDDLSLQDDEQQRIDSMHLDELMRR